MHIAYISLGSNLGDKVKFIEQAIVRLSEQHKVIAQSRLYTSDAVGYSSENTYVNAIVAVGTNKSPETLLKSLLSTETQMGRKRSDSHEYEDRCIDLDLLLYDDLVMTMKDINIPHPRMHQRAFVLLPLLEIADPNHPTLNKKVSELVAELSDNTAYLL